MSRSDRAETSGAPGSRPQRTSQFTFDSPRVKWECSTSPTGVHGFPYAYLLTSTSSHLSSHFPNPKHSRTTSSHSQLTHLVCAVGQNDRPSIRVPRIPLRSRRAVGGRAAGSGRRAADGGRRTAVGRRAVGRRADRHRQGVDALSGPAPSRRPPPDTGAIKSVQPRR